MRRMGMLIDGIWRVQSVNPNENDGEFRRKPVTFRDHISREKGARFAPEKNRYHLYVSRACPWAHRTLIYRNLKDLQKVISISVVSPKMFEDSWSFHDYPGVIKDDVNRVEFLREVYLKADSTFTGRITVPVLWDKKEMTIVNNESSEIIRMFNTEFNEVTGNDLDFYPAELRDEIDEVNELVYEDINNGVYKAGFASTQAAYEKHACRLFERLNWLEERLSRQRYLVGSQVTEADWRLFPTLVRFDPVYFGHFKCNLKRIADYSNIYNYLKDLYQVDGIAETVNFDHIKTHYYVSHETINPTRIVPIGPTIELQSKHDRDRF